MSGERNFLSLGDKRSVCADLLGFYHSVIKPCVVTMWVSAPFYQLLMKRVGSVTMNGSRKSGKFFHFSVLGWTQEEIGEGFSIAQQTVSDVLTGNGHLADFGKLLGPNWNEKGLQQEAERLGIPLVKLIRLGSRRLLKSAKWPYLIISTSPVSMLVYETLTKSVINVGAERLCNTL